MQNNPACIEDMHGSTLQLKSDLVISAIVYQEELPRAEVAKHTYRDTQDSNVARLLSARSSGLVLNVPSAIHKMLLVAIMAVPK